MECGICFEEKKTFILQCKHSVCLDCYPKIRFCPFCRKEIEPILSPLEFLYKRLKTYFYEYLFS